MQQNKQGVFLRLMAYMKPHWGTLLLALLLVLAATAGNLLRPIIIGQAIDTITSGGLFATIVRYFGIYIGLLLAATACNMIQMLMLQKLGQNIIFQLRQEIFAHIHRLSLRFFDVTPVGRIVTRVTNDVETLNELFSTILVTMVKNAVLILGYAGVMLYFQWQLALLGFALLPIVFILTHIFTRLYRSTHRITRTKLSALNTYLSENLSAMNLFCIMS